MFLRSSWRKLSIKKKIFFETTALLIIAFTLIYLVIFFVLPKVYEDYKIIVANKSLDKLTNVLKVDEKMDIEETLNLFVYSTNMQVFIINKDNYIVYPVKKEEDGSGSLFNDNSDRKYKMNLRVDLSRNIFIKAFNKEYKMLVHIPMNIAKDTTTVIISFIPIFFIFAVIIATLMSIINSRALSKPLIHINNIAKKMAKLDFHDKFEIKGTDEVNQLCESLNDMSFSLQDTIEKLENANKSLRDDIEKQNIYDKQRRDFIATISHELKSPITIISGQLEGMIYNIGAYKDREKYLKQSFAVIQEMKKLVEELLQLTKFEKHGFEVIKSNVNMLKVIEDIVKAQSFFIEEKQIKIDIKGDFNVEVDMSLIRKAINNLINNSIKYSPRGALVKIRLLQEEHNTLTIENFGVTISDEDIKEIFNAFYRVDKSRNKNTGGTGLGLYIVKTILEAHGNIEYFVESKENSVKFTLIFK